MNKLRKPNIVKKVEWLNNTSKDEILAEVENAICAALNHPDTHNREIFLSYFGSSIPTTGKSSM